MKSRFGIGGSADKPEELRQKLFESWLANRESQEFTQAEIARQHAVDPYAWMTMRKKQWFEKKKQAAGVE